MGRLRFVVEDDAHDERQMTMGVLRSLSSPRERVETLKTLQQVYGALETELDTQGDESASGRLWKELGARMRRAPAIDKALESERAAPVFSKKFREDHDSDERLWSPATRQFVRRVRVAVDAEPDLLLGHVFALHIHNDLDLANRLSLAAAERSFGFGATYNDSPVAPETALDALDAVSADLDDATHDLIVHEAARALKLQTRLYVERPGLWRGATTVGIQLGIKKLTDRLRPSP